MDAANLPLFMAAVLPALFYLFVIYLMGKNLVSWKSAVTYVIFGSFSITILQYGLHFIFPTILDYFFTNRSLPNYDLANMKVTYPSTIYSILFLCFVQVGLKEELSKMGAFLLAGLPRRHKTRQEKDSLFAIMFYSCCVAVGFAIVENIHYAQQWLENQTWEDTKSMLIQRSIFAVLSHMIAGLIMGYGLAMASISKGLNKVFFFVVPALIATLYHGYYNFLFMTSNPNSFIIIGEVRVHIQASTLMLISLFFTFLLGSSLRRYSLRYGKVLRKKEKQALIRKKAL
jgi:RsiW-degrading membrane proteinase PrsW (M82 family)